MTTLSAVVKSEENRFFNPNQPWVYAPSSLSAYDGSVTITENGVTGPAIDCSHFVMESLLSGGYSVPYLTSANFKSIVQGTSSSYYTPTANQNIQAGDVIVFNGHVGLVTNYNPATGIGTYDGAQSSSSGLKESVLFTTNVATANGALVTNPVNGQQQPVYWGTSAAPVVGAVQPNASAYSPTAAAQTLDSINSYVNKGLATAGKTSYFSPSQTSGSNPTGSDPQGGGGYDPGENPDGSSPNAPWTQTTITTSGGITTDTVSGVNADGSTQYQLVTTTQSSGAESISVSGDDPNTISASNAQVTIAAGATASLAGSTDNISTGQQAYLSITGGGNTITDAGKSIFVSVALPPHCRASAHA